MSIKNILTFKVESLRPLFCKHCRAEGKLHVHSKHHRKSVYTCKKWLNVGFITIYRFRCYHCLKTIAVFPSFLCKYGRLDLRYVEAFLTLLDKGHSLKSASNIVFKNSNISKRTFQRIKNSFIFLIHSYANDFLKLAIHLNSQSPSYFKDCNNLLSPLKVLFRDLLKIFPQFKMITVSGFLKMFYFQNIFLLFPNILPTNLSSP